jgi:hypothetical protein
MFHDYIAHNESIVKKGKKKAEWTEKIYCSFRQLYSIYSICILNVKKFYSLTWWRLCHYEENSCASHSWGRRKKLYSFDFWEKNGKSDEILFSFMPTYQVKSHIIFRARQVRLEKFVTLYTKKCVIQNVYSVQ